ncbi:MAG: hypothetical protein O2874_04785 [Verrucomicrobia bacterium]|nr:hypothetical protein [Verrucomicrobiota bacterium]
MENNTEPTSEATAENTGAENINAILSIEDLTSSFMGKVEENNLEEPTETDAVIESDATEVADSEEDQNGNLISQTNNETEEGSDEGSDDFYFFRVSKISRLWAFPE